MTPESNKRALTLLAGFAAICRTRWTDESEDLYASVIANWQDDPGMGIIEKVVYESQERDLPLPSDLASAYKAKMPKKLVTIQEPEPLPEPFGPWQIGKSPADYVARAMAMAMRASGRSMLRMDSEPTRAGEIIGKESAA